jgi:hypothetical protein
MKSGDALREFKRLLEARSTKSEVSVPVGIDAMIDFYRNTRADDCPLDNDGDMLLFQWGTYDRGDGLELELNITRQFIRADAEDDEIWQLSLTFFFPQNAIARGNRWCHTPDEADDFAKFVRSHAAYAAVAHAAPVRVALDFECAG